MKRRRTARAAACLLLVGTVLTAFVAIAADVGSQGDPLVTLSYLNDTFLGQVLSEVDQKLAQRDQDLTAQFERELLLREQSGQTLTGEAGCQVLLRAGAALCVSPGRSTPGLVDLTDGGTVNDGGALVQNHLYLMTDSRGVTASGGPVTLLVLGEYVLV